MSEPGADLGADQAVIEALSAAARALLLRCMTRPSRKPLLLLAGIEAAGDELEAVRLATSWPNDDGRIVIGLTEAGHRAARVLRDLGDRAAAPPPRKPDLRVLSAEIEAPAERAPEDVRAGRGKRARPEDKPTPERQLGEIWPDCPVQPLGVHGQVFYYLDLLRQLQPVDNHTKDRMRALFGGRSDMLGNHFPRWSKGTEAHPPKVIGWDQEQAATAMMRACAEKGVWSPIERVRGLGAWPDDAGGVVLHCGDGILSGGRWREPGALAGYVYPGDTATPRPTRGSDPSAARKLLDQLCTWSWQREDLDAALALGWMVAAMFGGALRWRPLIWITGDRGTGKSSLQDLLEFTLGGRGAVLKSSDPTAAGVWQFLMQSTVPVLIDELEAAADNRRSLDVIKLARQAASGGVILRGGADHKGHQFKARSAFAFSSILIPPLLDQDISRIALLKLNPLPKGAPRLELVERELRELGQALRGAVLDQWGRWPATLDVYREALAEAGHDSRSADQYGTLLAMVDMVLETSLPDAARADEWAGKLGIETIRDQTDELSDWHRCLNHMLGQHLDIFRSGERYTLGRWVLAAAGLREYPDPVRARDALPGYGLRVEGRGEMAQVWVANRHPQLDLMFRDTHWGSGVHAQAMARVPCAQRLPPRNYSGVNQRGWSVPLTSVPNLFGDEGTPAPTAQAQFPPFHPVPPTLNPEDFV